MKKILSIMLSASLLLTLFAAFATTSVSASGKGDVDNDGYITTSDVRTTLKACVGSETLAIKQTWWADYDVDGSISTSDVRLLLKVVLTTEDNRAIDYVNVTGKNTFGDRSVSIVGDSISYGAGSNGDVATNSYVGIIRSAINQKTGSNNYGFASIRARTWGENPAFEIHDWPTKGGEWETEIRDRDNLIGDGFFSTGHWNYLDVKVREGYNYQYFCVYYQKGPGRGIFSVASDSSDKTTLDGQQNFVCEADSETPARTGFYRMSDFDNRTIRITVQTDGKPVTITGIGYYNDLTGVVVNNYSCPGLSLAGSRTSETSGVTKKVLGIAAKADTVIFALGYNDSHFSVDPSFFSEKIDYLIEQINQNGSHLIVNDMCWYIPSVTSISMNKDLIDFYKGELKRLARETGGVYLDQQAIHGDAVLQYIYDGAHPNPDGHWVIADTILQAMGLR
ncbi:MAG: hypothetical protein IJU16_04735 [Clostridia bacterium]|nr:hypothetical protein [Clostridia bacterium]